MNMKIAVAAAAACVGLVACDQGEPQVAARDDAAQDSAIAPGAQERGDAGGASDPAAGRPAPGAAPNAPPGAPPGVTDTQAGGAAPDSANAGQSAAANALQDAAAGAVGQADAAITGGDTEAFLRNAALGSIYEIQAGGIAMRRSPSAAVQQIGQMLIEDHQKLAGDLAMTVALARVSFSPPTKLDERRQGLLDNLEAASAEDFDEVFLDQQEAAHAEALTLFQTYVSRGDVDELQVAAEKAIPVLEAHEERVKTAQETVADAG